MEVPSASRFCSPGVGGSAISYANVAAFEVGLGGPAVKPGPLATVGLGFLIVVSNPIKIDLNPTFVDEISCCLADFLANAAIFYFKGLWPSLSNLHA